MSVSLNCKFCVFALAEDWGGVDRNHFDAIVSQQDAAETYLPAFQSCVQRGNASGIMCSCVLTAPHHLVHGMCSSDLVFVCVCRYNSVNGVPSCANAEILTTIARETWGFQVCHSCADVHTLHALSVACL